MPMLMFRAKTNGFTPICQSMGSSHGSRNRVGPSKSSTTITVAVSPAARIARTHAPMFASVLLGMMIDRGFITLRDSRPRRAHLARAGIAPVNRCVHQLPGVCRHQFARCAGHSHELVVFADLHGAEPILLPPGAAVDERCANGIVGSAAVFPPPLSIREADRVVAGDALACLGEPRELVGQPARRRMVIVVPVRDEFSGRSLTAEVALVADPRVACEMDQADAVVVRNEIPYVRSVRQNEHLRVARLLLEETHNRPG